MKGTPTPRGIRNNNPLNIRLTAIPWKGKVEVNTDGTFEQFQSMFFGIRAALVNLRTYIDKRQCDTIRKIIFAWAPPSDGNNCQRYINFVSQSANLSPDRPLSFDRADSICLVAQAMAKFETGELLPLQLFQSAYSSIVLEGLHSVS